MRGDSVASEGAGCYGILWCQRPTNHTLRLMAFQAAKPLRQHIMVLNQAAMVMVNAAVYVSVTILQL